MAASKKPRKKYRPKGELHNPIAYCISGYRVLSGETLTDLNLKNHNAMARMTAGQGSKDDWDMLVGATNMAIVMAEQGIGPEYKDDLLKGQDALYSVGKRYVQHERFVFTGDELKAMNEAMAIHDAQLEASRVIDVERATKEVQRRLRNKINNRSIVEREAA